MNINWDYVFGVVMGALVVTACKKTYEAGIKKGHEDAKEALEIFDAVYNHVDEDKEES